ncbi:MFS general substrate transporter [Thozetella sp. PMI_491]|nr:MFS general substrate transporter [Thozetella sp. PMI_491]
MQFGAKFLPPCLIAVVHQPRFQLRTCVGLISEKKISFSQAVRCWPRITIYSVALTSAIILGGFDISIISSVASLPQFQKVYGESFEDTYIIPALWLALWNAAVPAGAIAGSIGGGVTQDMFGRRLSIAIASILSAACVGVAYVSDVSDDINVRRSVFLVAKAFQGFGNGMLLCTTQTYLSENLPSALRGPGLALFPIFTLIGQLIGSIIVQVTFGMPGTSSYRTCFASQWPFTALPLIVSVLLPESPPWLIRMKKLDAARTAYSRLDTRADPVRSAAFEALKHVIEIEQETSAKEKVTYSQCFGGTDRRRTVIAMFASLSPTLFGLPLYAQASYYLQTLGMDAGPSLAFVIVGAVLGFVSTLGSFWTLTRFGRRALILSSLSIATVLWLSVGIAGCFSSLGAIWYIAICMMIILLIIGLGAWPASYAVAAETSSLRLRAKTQGVAGSTANLTTGLFSIALPYLYNPDQGRLGGRVGFVFAFFTAGAVLVMWAIIPELKDRSAAEIDEMFEMGLPTRSFKHARSQAARKH